MSHAHRWHRQIQRDAQRAEERPGLFAAMDFYRSRVSHRWATERWSAHPLYKAGPAGVFCDLSTDFESLIVRVDSLPPAARASCMARTAEMDHELREVIASLSRPLRAPRTAESVERIVDAIMRGY